MYGNFLHATNDASHYTKPPTVYRYILTALRGPALIASPPLALPRTAVSVSHRIQSLLTYLQSPHNHPTSVSA